MKLTNENLEINGVNYNLHNIEKIEDYGEPSGGETRQFQIFFKSTSSCIVTTDNYRETLDEFNKVKAYFARRK